jgi:hypothetical protein
MIDWVMRQWANVWIALGLYWLPVAICAVGYVIRTWRNYRKDRKARDTEKFYSPTDTVGTLIGRGIVSVVPIANLCAAAFDLAPEMLGRFIERIGRIFNQPLVPRRRSDNGPAAPGRALHCLR